MFAQQLNDPLTSADRIENLLTKALQRLPLIAFSLVVETWRYDVFSGRVAFEDWNTHWWKLREKFQGVGVPYDEDRSAHFDPMAKFHVPDNTPYMP